MFTRGLIGTTLGALMLAASAHAAPALGPRSAMIEAAPPPIEQIYYYRGGYYPYRWRGGYYHHRRWYGGYWRYW